MRIQLTLVITGVIMATASITFAVPDPIGKADRIAIVSACASDANSIGCGAEQDPSKFLLCIHNYKVAHPKFKVSAGCKAALDKLRVHDQTGN